VQVTLDECGADVQTKDRTPLVPTAGIGPSEVAPVLTQTRPQRRLAAWRQSVGSDPNDSRGAIRAAFPVVVEQVHAVLGPRVSARAVRELAHPALLPDQLLQHVVQPFGVSGDGVANESSST
jgi:hypothetical protein